MEPVTDRAPGISQMQIDSYFDEGKKQWKTASSLVTGRAFYELWESVCQPEPFLLPETFEIAGRPFVLSGASGTLCGRCEWSEAFQCASLIAECDSWRKEYLLRFGPSGEPEITEQEKIFFDDAGLLSGELLELVSEVVAYIREHDPGKDILKLKRREFLAYLSECPSAETSPALGTLKRKTLPSIRGLLARAVADRPADELDLQMSLPLDGHYAMAVSGDPEDVRVPEELSGCAPRRTPREVRRTVELLKTASNLSLDYEREFVLPFTNAEFCGGDDGKDAVLKMRLDPELPIEEGDLFQLFAEEGIPCGIFSAEVVDGDSLYGKISTPLLRDFLLHKENYFARLQRSPRFYTSEAIGRLSEMLGTEKKDDSGAMAYLLGLKETPFTVSPEPQEKEPEELAPSQRLAWRAAVRTENPLVLIQGPPGTGKTFVLEQVLRTLCFRGLEILVSAPSNAAVDNICRRLKDLPVLRCGRNELNIAPDVVESQWRGRPANLVRFRLLREKLGCGSILAGTHFGLLRDSQMEERLRNGDICDAVVFDEAGMSSLEELLLCTRLGRRAILFGDHRQLPPFPLRPQVLETLRRSRPVVTREENAILTSSAMEWLIRFRGFPVLMLKESYRCQNPRLLRFASLLFYNAEVRPAAHAEYYRLSYPERMRRYPPETLCFYSTSELPPERKRETLSLEGRKPGLSNHAEALVCVHLFYRMLRKHPLREITMIAPYRRQVRVLRGMLNMERARREQNFTPEEWRIFLGTRIATVDSFQGAESDVVIICYVRSNERGIIGFTDNPNRINVAHTRCRKELHVTGDLVCLKRGAHTGIFERMERAFRRDGVIVTVTERMLDAMKRENES